MPEFTFTSPEGAKYTVRGPDGATKEQAFSILSNQMQSPGFHADKADAPQSDNMPFLVPALKKADGTIVPGQPGDQHKDLGNNPPESQRGFIVPGRPEKMFSREEAYKYMGIPATVEDGKLHSEDINKAFNLGQWAKDTFAPETEKSRLLAKGQSAAPEIRSSVQSALAPLAKGDARAVELQFPGAEYIGHLAQKGTEGLSELAGRVDPRLGRDVPLLMQAAQMEAGLNPGQAAIAGGIARRAADTGTAAIGKTADAAARSVAELPTTAAKGLLSAAPTEAAKSAAEAGYSLPARMASEKPTKTAGVIETIGGKSKLDAAFTAKNQGVTDTLAAKSIGLPADAPISEPALDQFREGQYQHYENLKNVLPPMTLDATAKGALRGVSGVPAALEKKFPGAISSSPSVQAIRELATHDTISATDTVELIKTLKRDAKENFRSTDPDRLRFAQAQFGAVKALEGQMERSIANAPANLAKGIRSLRNEQSTLIKDITQESNSIAQKTKQVAELKSSPALESRALADRLTQEIEQSRAKVAESRSRLPDIQSELDDYLAKSNKVESRDVRNQLVGNFRGARSKMAMSHAIENALDPATGHVSAAKLNAMLNRGEPLTGELRTIAENYGRFKKVMGTPTADAASFSPDIGKWDIPLAAAGGFLSGHPVAALGGLVVKEASPPLARSMVLSPKYQQYIMGLPEK